MHPNESIPGRTTIGERWRILAGAVGALVLGTSSVSAAVTGSWNFTNGDLSATVGQPLTYLTWGGDTAAQTQFGTTTAFGINGINGEEARVMRFPAAQQGMGYSMPTPANPNGGGTLVNQWTLIMDVYYPAESTGKWRGLIDTDGGLINADSELFINAANGIGISGQYHGEIKADTWHRIAFAVDLSGANQIRKYIDGVEVGVQAADGQDGRWALAPGWSADLFTDNDGETAIGYVNSIQLHNSSLTKAELFALGGPSAAGIPTTIPTIPSFVASTEPVANATAASPKPTLRAVIDSGATVVDPASIQLRLNGVDVATSVTSAGNLFTAGYEVPALLAPDSEHTAAVVYSDSQLGEQTFTWSFKVAAYKEFRLPQPIVFEDFDEVAEGGLPAGWVATNLTSSITGFLDLSDPNSDSYLDWVVISRDTLATTFGQRRLNFNPVVVNGEPLASLVSGNFAYAESDRRSGNQVQVLITPDFNLSGHSDIHLAFYSTYEQNQDSLGAVEYSIDRGATWHPALYMVDQVDILRDGEGNIDAVATLTTARGDQAYGLGYGEFIGAAIAADLAPFISGRVDDNQYESKRVEVLRLERADNQAQVRLRFLQTGTASWYFGIDNVGLYSISELLPEIIQQPISQVVSAGTPLTLEVVATGTEPLSYQWRFEDEDLPGQTGASLTIPNMQAVNAGRYSVRIGNVAGETLSTTAMVRVFAGAITDDLVVHLKFDGAYTDASGRNNHGNAVGSPAFTAGRVGPQAVQLLAAGDYVTLGRPSDLDFAAATDFSVAFWAKVVAWGGDPSFVSNKDWNSGGNQGYVIATDGDGRIQWNLSGPPGGRKDFDSPGGVFSGGDWRHVVVTFERSGNATTYVDAQVVDVRPLTADVNDVSTPSGLATNVGQDGTGTYGSSFTDVSLDDLGIWRRVLTPQEVTGIYAAGLEGNDLSTVDVVQELLLFTGIVRQADTVVLTWSGAGTLQAAPAVDGPWTNVPGATSPHSVNLGEGVEFFRLVK